MNSEHQNGEPAKRSDEGLDHAIHQWGAERTASADHLEQLQRQIQAKLEAAVGAVETSTPHRQGVFWRAVIAIAALVLIAIGIFSIDWNRTPMNVAADESVFELARTDVGKQRQLYQRFAEVYGKELLWISDVDGELSVELESAPELARRKEFVGVKLVLVSRVVDRKEHGSWKLERSVSLLAGREERVQLNLNDENAFQLEIWAFPVEQHLVSVDLRCRFDLPVSVSVANSELYRSGKPINVYSLIQDGVEYRLYQSADRIGKANTVEDADQVVLALNSGVLS